MPSPDRLSVFVRLMDNVMNDCFWREADLPSLVRQSAL